MRGEPRAGVGRVERATHLHTVSLMEKTPLTEKTLQQPESQSLASALAGDVRGRGEIWIHEAGWHGGRVPPEIRHGNLRRGDPTPPERLVLRLFLRSFGSPQDGVLKKLHDWNSSFPAKSEDTLVPIKGPIIARLLMAEEFRDLVTLEQDFQHALRRRGLRDQEAAAVFLQPRRKVTQALRH